jgi:ferredoxin
MRITVDANRCTGQGRCYVVSPELFAPDDEGFCLQRGTEFEIAPEHESGARLAVGSCPEGAIAIVDKS